MQNILNTTVRILQAIRFMCLMKDLIFVFIYCKYFVKHVTKPYHYYVYISVDKITYIYGWPAEVRQAMSHFCLQL